LKKNKDNIAKVYRELTPTSVIIGIVLGVVLNLTNVYIALKIGIGGGTSIVAAIVGLGIIRGILKKKSIIENNINQTIASGISVAGTGVVFTLPALFLLNEKWIAAGEAGLVFNPVPFIFAGAAGALLGTIFITPLRKQMIDLERLPFPDGIATAVFLKTSSTGFGKAKLLLIGFLLGAIYKLLLVSKVLESLFAWLGYPRRLKGEDLHYGLGIIPEYFSPTITLSMVCLCLGMLVGKRGLAFFAGGILSWWVISPIAVNSGWAPGEGAEQLTFLYKEMIGPLGIGVLIGGALMGMIMTLPTIKAAFSSLYNVSKNNNAVVSSRIRSDEMPKRIIVFGFSGSVLLFCMAIMMTPGLSIVETILASVAGTLWIGLAGLIVAESRGVIGVSPMSGVALVTVTLMMVLLNGNTAAAMIIGVAVCVAVGQAGDIMCDLKTGFLVGGRPIKQQISQFFITWIGPALALGVVYILWKSGPGGKWGFGAGTDLPAPQAEALAGIIEGIKTGNVPTAKYIMGGTIGVLLSATPIAGLGVAIGLAMYLPFKISLIFGIGCFIRIFIQKNKGEEFCEHKLMPLLLRQLYYDFYLI